MTVIATYQDGSTREMPEEHAKVLKHVGQVTSYETKGMQTYMTRDMKAQRPEPPKVEEVEPPKRRGRPRKVQPVEEAPKDEAPDGNQATAETDPEE